MRSIDKLTNKNYTYGLKDSTPVFAEAFNNAVETIVEGIEEITSHIATSNVSDIYVEELDIPATAIVGTSAGDLGHANGFPLVVTPGSGNFLEFVSALLIFDGKGGAYADGGNVTINLGTTPVTGIVSAANSFGATGQKVYQFHPLSTAAYSALLNTGLNLTAASAFTAGNGTGVGKMHIQYRIHVTGF